MGAETLVGAAEQAVRSLMLVLVCRYGGGGRARGANSISQLVNWPTWCGRGDLNFLLVVHGGVGDKVTRSNLPQ